MTIPERIAIRDKYQPAMLIADQREADDYFEECVLHNLLLADGAKSREEAERDERISIGYYAGYYDTETRARVEKLFKCEHPVFGAVAGGGVPTAAEAFQKGFDYFNELKRSENV